MSCFNVFIERVIATPIDRTEPEDRGLGLFSQPIN